MHRLTIHKLGPIEHCELECSQFMTFTGVQASGKSTVAKAVYYFRTIKEDIIELAKAQTLEADAAKGRDEFPAPAGRGPQLRRALENCLREKFLRTFGSSWGMSDEMYLKYYFSEECFVKISLKNDAEYIGYNYIWITLSKDIKDFLQRKDHCFGMTPIGISEEELEQFRTEIYRVFHDNSSVVFIPAGRSMITLLSQQLNYIYATMDDRQKRLLDICTRDYLERILRLKPEFSEGLRGLAAHRSGKRVSPQIIKQALELVQKILRGTYRYNDGEERIMLDDGKYVKINFSSSGQQECVWILNLLFYYLLQPAKILFIIEEPESHLFPESQKYITELIALVNNCGHSVVLTTHSPYVLGTLNNLLYVHAVFGPHSEAAKKVIPQTLWLDCDQFGAWFVQNGGIDDCIDREIHMIQNERIDEISKTINNDFEELLRLQRVNKEGREILCL